MAGGEARTNYAAADVVVKGAGELHEARTNYVAVDVVVSVRAAPVLAPTAILEIAVTTNPFATTPVWVDVSSYLRSGNTRRGRSSDLDHVSAGTMTVRLNNRDRRFDPLNTAGPYYGNLLPNKRIRLSLSQNSVTYPIFDGYIERYEQGYEKGVKSASTADADAYVDIEASDAFGMFANMAMADATRSTENAGNRVSAILNNTRVGWPAALRDLDVGSSTLAAETFDATVTALDLLFEVDSTEQGRLFIDKSGYVVFADRNALFTETVYTTDQVVFGDNVATEVPYQDVAFDHARELVRNTIVVTNQALDQVFTAEDTTSQTAYGNRSYDVDVIDAAGTASQQTADNLLRLNKDPASRIKQFRVMPQRATAAYPNGLWAPILGLELGHRVNVKRRGAAYTIDEHYAVEEIAHDFGPGRWETTLGFGRPLGTDSYWIWGTGLWGTTTKWAW